MTPTTMYGTAEPDAETTRDEELGTFAKESSGRTRAAMIAVAGLALMGACVGALTFGPSAMRPGGARGAETAVPVLGQAAAREEGIRAALVDALDHLKCMETCSKHSDLLAAKVENDDKALVCSDFKKFSSDACIQSCECADKTVINEAVKFLCGPDSASVTDPAEIFGDAHHDVLSQIVLDACPAEDA